MIPVDLNRLREAMDSESWMVIATQKLPSDLAVLDVLNAAGAPLEAPRVWWCRYDQAPDLPENCTEICDALYGCGWVALVPVKGES